MFEGWGEFFLMVGSAAAVLIGLIFVVVTLMDDRPRDSVLAGSKLYMGPIVLNMSFVLALSAGALVPGIGARGYAAIAATCALWGAARGVWSVAGINKLRGSGGVDGSDVVFYGAVPLAIHLALMAVAWGLWRDAEWAQEGVAAVITALLLNGIRNEWDLVTWLAPKDDKADSFESAVQREGMGED